MAGEINRVIDGRNRSGLFSVATVVLENLLLRPSNVRYRIELGKEYLYFDRKVGPNVWEYFFNQPLSSFSSGKYLDEPLVSETGFLFDRQGLLDITNRSPSYDKAVIDSSRIFYDEVGFSELANQALEKALDRYWVDGRILSVHRRETDFNAHGQILPLSAFFDQINPYVDDGYKIFLATDSQHALSSFKKRYGANRVTTSNSTRSRFGRPLHTSRHLFKSPSEIGFEALTDAFLLSRGDLLIRTRSNVTTFARILNPGLPTIEIDHAIAYA